MVDKYYLGLDIGSNSIGWAVTDEDYNLLKLNGKTAWGCRLFDEASDAKFRRSMRSNRRRLQRRKYRIYLLNNYVFKDEINKIDPTFFLRLNESNLWLEDKSDNNKVKYPLFKNKDEEKEFYKNYKTIYHLRKAQIYDEEGSFKDVRYLYLTIHHIIKKRGNFLTESNYDINNPISDEIIENINDLLVNFIQDKSEDEIEVEQILDKDTYNQIFQILVDNIEKNDTKKCQREIKSFFKNGSEYNLNKDDAKEWNSLIDLFVHSVTGGSFKIGDEDLNETVSFTKNYEENRENYEKILKEKILLLDFAKQIYDAIYVKKFLGKHTYLSESMVDVYKKHDKELEMFKYIIKELYGYDHAIYKKIFNRNSDNYCKEKNIDYKQSGIPSYAKFIDNPNEYIYGKEKGYNSFLNNCKDFINSIKNNEEFKTKIDNNPTLKEYLNKVDLEIKNNSFLQRISDVNSSSFPHQFHEKELDIILINASKHFEFLNKDNNLQKIKDIFRYKVEYYYGPINNKSKYSNVVFKNDNYEKILPWNFNELVDKDKTSKKFIDSHVSDCTYLIGESVLPKCSIIYNDFINLNILNTLKINGSVINQDIKLKLFDFINKNKKTTIRQIKKYLKENYTEYKNEIVISGIDNENDNFEFNSPVRPILSPVFDLTKTDIISKIDEIVIKTLTIFDSSKEQAIKIIKQNFNNLTRDQEKAIRKLKCSGWGKLSKKFLTYTIFDEDGIVIGSILDLLKNNTKNLMQLMNDKQYHIQETINLLNSNKTENFTIGEKLKEVIESAPPMMRRPAIQAMKIAKEIKKITKNDPQLISIETRRTNEVKDKNGKGKKKPSRYKELEQLINPLIKDIDETYKENIQSVSETLENLKDDEINNIKINSESIYLYFKQLGYDIYTGKQIDFNDVINGTDKYNVDHIVPKSLIKDDSLDNKVLVNVNTNQKEKNSAYPLNPTIQKNCQKLWKYLYSKKLMSSKKYNSLIRKTPISEEEKVGFINRQLNVLDYSNILVRKIFEIIFPKTQILFQKAENVSYIRNEYEITKVRELNDTHHAVDAYLNVVAGDILKKYYGYTYYRGINTSNLKTLNPENVIKHEFKVNEEMLKKVINICEQKDMLLTFREKYLDAAFYDQNITARPDRSNNKLLYPIHSNNKLSDISKYGGFNNLSRSYFVVGKNNKNKRVMISVPIIFKNLTNDELNKRLCEIYSKSNKNIKFDLENKIYPNSLVYFDNDKTKFLLSLSNNAKLKLIPIVPLFLNNCNRKYLKLIIKMKDYIVNEEKTNNKDEYKLVRNKENSKYDIISKELNINLKNILLNELNKKERKYFKDKENIIKISELLGNESNFDNLKIDEQIKNLIESVKYFNRKDGHFRVAMDKFINENPTIRLTSVTGLFFKDIKL